MEILQLKYFCDAAKTQNFSETARKFDVPPSDISQTINRLEKELGCSLFDRSSNRVRLSEKGTVFFEGISKAMEYIEDACNEIKEETDKMNGKIRICVGTNRNIVTGAIEEFKNKYPEASFYINHRFSEEDIYDFVVSNDSFIKGSYEGELILNEKMALAVSKQNPLSDVTELSAENLRDKRFITMQNGSSLYKITEKVCSDMGFAPKITIQSDDPFYIRKYVEMDLGIAVVPTVSWRGQFSDNVKLLTLENCERCVYLYRRKTGYMTRSAAEFYSALKESFSNQAAGR